MLSLLLTGCAVSVFQGYKPVVSTGAFTPESWFWADSGHFLFNAHIRVFDNHFSGLMVVKPEATDHYRVVFITEVGLKVFDMEFLPGKEPVVHYVMEAMNRKALVATLKNDIGMVLMHNMSVIQPVVLRQKGNNDLILQYMHGGNKNRYHFRDIAFNRPYKVRQMSGVTSRVEAGFYGSMHSGIDSVKISHTNIKLTIDINRIHEEVNHADE
ncbi:MAG: hypothetical protein JXQ80_07820 [Bacteroidales bacterium]|nr:hypothetical protein [Bacteroidales bacterium]